MYTVFLRSFFFPLLVKQFNILFVFLSKSVFRWLQYQSWEQLSLLLFTGALLVGAPGYVQSDTFSYNEIIVFGYGKTGSAALDRMKEKLRPEEQVSISVVDTDAAKALQCQQDVMVASNDRLSVACFSSIEQLPSEVWHSARLIMEFIPEVLEYKRNLYAQIFEKLGENKHAVVFSNTSSFSVAELTDQLPESLKSRLAVNHLYLRHGESAEVSGLSNNPEAVRTVEKVINFNQLININSHHLLRDDLIGHAFNRIWFQVKMHFISMMPFEEKQIMNEAASDLVFKLISGRRLGIFSTLNHIGLQTSVLIWQHWYDKNETLYPVPKWYENLAADTTALTTSPFHSGESLANQMDEQWLYDHAQVNLENAILYARQQGLFEENWEDIVFRNTEPNAYLQNNAGLRFACFMLIKIITDEYQSTIKKGVIEKNNLKQMVSDLMPGASGFIHNISYF